MLTITYFKAAGSFAEADLEGSLFHPIFGESFLAPGQHGFRETIEALEFSQIEDGDRILFATVGDNLGRQLVSGDLLDRSALISSWELGYGLRDVMRFDFDPEIRRDGDAANPGGFPMPIFTSFDADGARITGNDPDNYLGGRGADDRLFGGEGDDRLEAFGGSDRLNGGGGDDVVISGNGDDRASGGGGGDRVIGDAGADVLRGDDGRDALKGGGGNDRMFGGTGRDTAAGGDGSDVFFFRSLRDAGKGSRSDLILDFERGQDKINLAAIDADTGSAADAFSFIGDAAYSDTAGELRFARGRLSGDVDGDGRGDFRVELADGANLAAADLIL